MKALLDEMYDLAYREGWDSAVEAFTTIVDNDILTAPSAEDVERSVILKKNLQSLRKRNPGRVVQSGDRQKRDARGVIGGTPEPSPEPVPHNVPPPEPPGGWSKPGEANGVTVSPIVRADEYTDPAALAVGD